MPDRLIHQRDHEKIAVSKRSAPTSRSWPVETLNRALRTPCRRARRVAAPMPTGSGSSPTTERAIGAMSQTSRPSPVPTSSTSLPRKYGAAWRRRSSRSSPGRTALGQPISPTSPRSAISLARAREHRAGVAADGGGPRRVEQRLLQLVRRLRAGVPPDHLAVRAEELVEYAVLGARVAARVPPEPVAALGHHERLPHA